MSEADEFRCFVGSLSWSTTDGSLKDAFKKFGHLTEAKGNSIYLGVLVDLTLLFNQSTLFLDKCWLAGLFSYLQIVLDKFSGRSRGFGFVTFDNKADMEEAIEAMNGIDLDGRSITVERAQPQGPGNRDRDSGRDYERDRGRDYDRGRGKDFGGARGRGSDGDCFKCGKPGHFARECPSGDGGRGDRYGGREDSYGGSHGSNNRYGPDRNGDRFSSRNRDGGSRGGSGGDRYSRDRSGPYERPNEGGGHRY
ncbi:hypothetical protein ZIOFF_044363 [Zingiber officinale]|uniref:Uncharacterized protein n=1 Tax=Zingiber officinale TaxID=94328 RepID=A0A8J5L079_ZINOF|nr:hypothetical protein ZIOFF_044363 [Zingiber officinale]